MATVQEKYDYLLSKLKVTDVDLWEHNALIRMDALFFQFGSSGPGDSIDKCVEAAMQADRGVSKDMITIDDHTPPPVMHSVEHRKRSDASFHPEAFSNAPARSVPVLLGGKMAKASAKKIGCLLTGQKIQSALLLVGHSMSRLTSR